VRRCPQLKFLATPLAPSKVQRQRPWSESQWGEATVKLKTLLVFKRSMEVADLPTFLQFVNAKRSDVCVIFAKKSCVATKLRGEGRAGLGARHGPKTATVR